MEQIYLIRSINYSYDNRQIWPSGGSRIIEMHKSKLEAEERLHKMNIDAYQGKYIHNYITTFENRNEVEKKLEEYLNHELGISMKLKNYDSWDPTFRLPKNLTDVQLRVIKEIVGINFYILEYTNVKDKWIVRYCVGETDEIEAENPYPWLKFKEYNSKEEAEEDMISIVIQWFWSLHIYDSGSYWDKRIMGSINDLTNSPNELTHFLKNSKFFDYDTNADYNQIKVIYELEKTSIEVIDKSREDRTLEYDLVNFNEDIKYDCRKLLSLLSGNFYEILRI